MLPLSGVRSAVHDLRLAVGRDVHTEGGRPLRTKSACIYGTVGVPLDVYDAPFAVVDERGAAHRAIGTDTDGRPYALVGDARADVAGLRAYGMLDRRSDVVPDLLPETIFLRNLEEHMSLSVQIDRVVRVLPFLILTLLTLSRNHDQPVW